MKPGSFVGCLIIAVSFLSELTARSEHFDIDLTVEGAGDRQEAHRDESPPFEGHNRRAIFHGRHGEPLRFQFLFTNANPHVSLKQVEIRYYIVSTKDGTLKASPSADGETVFSGRFVLDFKFKGRLGYKGKFSILAAGRYLLRVESTKSGADHEHFAAIDLEIE